MKLSLVVTAVTAVASAQISIGTPSRVPTSAGIIAPSGPTSTATGPIQTGSACAQVANLARSSRSNSPSVSAELAYACLKSVPIDKTAASNTVTTLKNLIQFQSTLSYLKNPPSGYANAGVDLLGGLDSIKSKVDGGSYSNEYDFETDISKLLVSAHDGHLSFGGYAFGGVFIWQRNKNVALISASKDGNELPKIWAVRDFNTSNANYAASAVLQIDGKPATEVLQDESALNNYHDPDTRYNSLFFLQPAESYGYFTNPLFYPNPSVNVTFENGTSSVYQNLAVIADASSWESVGDPQSFYDTFITPSSSPTRKQKRSPQSLPRHLQHRRDIELDRRYLPVSYPTTVVVKHSSADVTLGGYFIDGPSSKVGVLVIQTFDTANVKQTVEFQSVVQNYISAAQAQKVTKHIIDVRTNGGGKVLLGYDTYLQFFPSQKPQLLARYRGHPAMEVYGQNLSSYSGLTTANANLYTSPFNFHSYLNKDNGSFSSWSDMYRSSQYNSDKFTELLKYNLSDPSVTSDPTLGIGITVTGYNSRNNFTTDPFKAEDLIILTDGICASTCNLFTELMVQQSSVKTLAVGGRASSGPMQAVGGTKGSLVLENEYLSSLGSYVASRFASSGSLRNSWLSYFPGDFDIATTDASINFQDTIRKGLESNGIPTQFLNDSASCRMYYQPQHYLNITALWSKAASVAFGKNGGLDTSACVPGSVTSRQAQQGQGSGSPVASGTSTASPSATGKKNAAAGVVRPVEHGALAAWVCTVVLLGSFGVGASLI